MTRERLQRREHIIASPWAAERLSDSQGRPLHITSSFRILEILSGGTIDVRAAGLRTEIRTLHSFSSLSYDRSEASSKTSSPHSRSRAFSFK